MGVLPPAGGATAISGSMLIGGQITPLTPLELFA